MTTPKRRREAEGRLDWLVWVIEWRFRSRGSPWRPSFTEGLFQKRKHAEQAIKGATRMSKLGIQRRPAAYVALDPSPAPARKKGK